MGDSSVKPAITMTLADEGEIEIPKAQLHENIKAIKTGETPKAEACTVLAMIVTGTMGCIPKTDKRSTTKNTTTENKVGSLPTNQPRIFGTRSPS